MDKFKLIEYMKITEFNFTKTKKGWICFVNKLATLVYSVKQQYAYKCDKIKVIVILISPICNGSKLISQSKSNEYCNKWEVKQCYTKLTIMIEHAHT